MKHILAVDIGTTSAKALVVSEAGEVLATAQEYYRTYNPEPDYAEQNPEEIFEAVKKVIRLAADAVMGRVDGVSFSSAMHSLILVDKNGAAISPMITWADLRSKAEAYALRDSDAGKIIYSETGTPIHPMSPLCKMLWLKKYESTLYKQAYKFIGIREYIGYKFFGEFSVDHSIASATGLFNGTTMKWCEKALEVTGISGDRLSNPCPVYSVSRASKEITTALGLPPDTPWILGANDGCLANLGSDAMDGETLSVTVGTSGAVRKAVKKINPDKEGRTFHYLLDEENIITGGATNNGAVLVQWFAESILKEKINVHSFGERASKVPAGSAGLIFLPYVLGERAPVYSAEATGVFFGVRRHHTTEHFMRAVLEGVCLALYSISEIVEGLTGNTKKMMASGGFIKSPHWVQIMSSMFNKEVHVRGSADASSLGAALLGFKALGIKTNFQFPTEKIFYPDLSDHQVYQKYFSVYKRLYPHLSTDFKALDQITDLKP